MRRFTAVLGLLLGGAALLACSQQAERAAGNCCPCEASAGASDSAKARAADRALVSWLATARAYHHQADLHLQQGESERALAAVREILKLPAEKGWLEAEEVRLDAVARLGKLLAGADKVPEALQVVEKELAEAHRPSFYLANLHAVRGELLELEVKRREARGAKEAAREAAREAIQAFERSIALNKELQAQLRERKAP